MAYSYVRYTGNGSTTNYTFSFPTISTDHIKVRVNGTLVTNWSFLNSSTIQFAAAPANAAIIEIRRETPKDSPIVDFADGSVLLERDLDLLATWQLYVAQETEDDLEDTIRVDSQGRFDALNKRIINVADPVAAQDVVTKNWIETTYTDDIEAIALAAASSASAAAGSASTATTQASNAAASAVAAANSAAAAATALDNFDDRYLGQKASDPSVDNDGNALVTGALYYNTTDGAMRVYTGTGWINASSAQVVTMKTYVYVATAGQTVFSGNDANGSSLTFVAPYIIVSLNGLELRPTVDYTMAGGSSVTLLTGASAGDELQIQAFSNFNVANLQSANVSFTQGVTGSVTRSVDVKLKESVSVKDFGAVGDGVADDTAAIQAALNRAGNILIPAGTYIVNPLQMVSNTTLVFETGAVLMAKAGYGLSDRVLNIIGVSNITIHGNFAKIKMRKADYTTGDNRHCVNMYGVQNVTIYDLVTEDSGGDGFYVGNVVCDNVSLINCVADNHWRNGLSITNARNMNVIGGHYKNTSGYVFGPCAGIDIESNLLDNYHLENINIIGVYTSGNIGGGILVTPQSKFAPVSITLQNCTSYDDGGVVQGKGAISCTAAMAYTPSTPSGLIGKIEGVVTIENCSILEPRATAFASVNWTENAPHTVIKNLYVLNPYSGGEAGAANRQKCGVLIRGETPSSGTFGTSVGHISFDGLKIEDTRTVPLMYSPIYFEPADEATKPLKNISIRDIEVTAGQWVSGSVFPAIKAGTLAITNVELFYKTPFIVSQPTSSMDAGKIGTTISTITSSNFTLPSAANYIGSTFNFLHRNAGNFQITPQSGDVIQHYSLEAGGGIIARDVGSSLSVKATAAGVWQVVAADGGWAIRTGYEPRYPMTFDTAVPTTGTWVRGDIIWNRNPAASGKIGWVCTTGGTPGTWKPFGPIDA